MKYHYTYLTYVPTCAPWRSFKKTKNRNRVSKIA